jgi:hypothetical protein
VQLSSVNKYPINSFKNNRFLDYLEKKKKKKKGIYLNITIDLNCNISKPIDKEACK